MRCGSTPSSMGKAGTPARLWNCLGEPQQQLQPYRPLQPAFGSAQRFGIKNAGKGKSRSFLMTRVWSHCFVPAPCKRGFGNVLSQVLQWQTCPSPVPPYEGHLLVFSSLFRDGNIRGWWGLPTLPTLGAVEGRRAGSCSPALGTPVLMKMLEQGLGWTSCNHHRAAEQMCLGTQALSRAS